MLLILSGIFILYYYLLPYKKETGKVILTVLSMTRDDFMIVMGRVTRRDNLS